MIKQIIKNRYVKSWCFTSPQERSYFLHGQNIQNELFLKGTYGEFCYCYICFDSLSRKEQFTIIFDSYISEEKLNFLHWYEKNLSVMDTDETIYFIDYNLNITFSLEITTPLIGLYLLSEDKILIMEETSFRIVNSIGQILKEELFDLAINFSLENDKLLVKTKDENKVYLL
jgi:hypothetical protein